MKKKKVNSIVFVPAIILFCCCIFLAFYNNNIFSMLTSSLYSWILDQFGWLFILTTMAVFVACIALYFSPLGHIRIGGKKAKPTLSTWNWFSITLCTTVGSGIVFWGAAEPVQHMLYPPVSSGIEALSPDAAVFAMSTVFRHWTLLPYGLYTLMTVVFAFVYYNMKKPFSLGSVISPITSEKHEKSIGNIIDFICVFSLVFGLSASLYTAVLSINGGLNKIWGVDSDLLTWGIIIAIISCITLTSAVSGINKGIKYLSNINVYIFFIILAVILIFGGTTFIFGFAVESLGDFIVTFFKNSLFTGTAANDPWAKSWTMYYFANWMAWTPITAVFLGRICYGRKIKEIILMNLLVTSLFGILWFTIISGATVNSLMNNPSSGLIDAFNTGYENVIYQLFNNLHLDTFLVPLYLVAVLISLVTASDSTTLAISSLCSSGISPDSLEPPKFLIVIWVAVVGIVTWIMMSISEGITGIKMLSNIGGLPAMFLIILVIVCAVKIAISPQKYNDIDHE
ncbi:BCCT family transporter [Eubacterium sp. 1001713B170207_170306_E7]|uniref:BCCT family transporter n=1 Tax=Eubacterium sp. 1001713B170207_170306_E7 TaxID=2787097 RepID=UPI0018985418|nr:BCCT family transporter [Eubacterium sp. 1001713B170207_170306_E7]